MKTNEATRHAKQLGYGFDLDARVWLGLRRALLVLAEATSDDYARRIIDRAWAQGQPYLIFSATKRATRAQPPAAPSAPTGLMSRAEAQRFANEWGPVLGLSFAERRQLASLARQLGDDAARDRLAAQRRAA